MHHNKEKAACGQQAASPKKHGNSTKIRHIRQEHNVALKSALVSRLGELVRRLYPEKPLKLLRGDWRVGNHGSLSISADGVFYDHEAGVGGDVFRLIQHALRCDFRTALHWAQGFIGNAPVHLCRKELSVTVKKDAELDDRERMDKALKLWQKSMLPQGTIAETYLRNRGITLPLPASIRFLPHARNHTSSCFHPALIAAVQNTQGKLTAVQVIYLTDSGRKITGDNVMAKLTRGVVSGGAVRLAPLTPSLVLCEGIEDGLSILQACPDSCVWATLGTSNLIGVHIPDTVTDVVIACDNDDAGKNAARKLATRLKAKGKQARLALPSIGKDFNEMLQQGGISHV